MPAALRAWSTVDLGDADIPRDRYLSKDIHDLEVDKVWNRVWQVVCREDEIPDTGDLWVHEVAGTSLIVLRSGARRGEGVLQRLSPPRHTAPYRPWQRERVALPVPRLYLAPGRIVRTHAE